MTYDWSRRLRTWIDEKGWSDAHYTRLVNENPKQKAISYTVIKKYLDHQVDNPRGDTLDRLAKPFGKTGFELRHGSRLENETGVVRIPLLTMTDIGRLTRATSNFEAWEGRSVDVLSNDVGAGWFGVVVPDDACAPKIRKGATVYCNPDAPVEPGVFVVAKVPGVSAGVCRRYRAIDGFDNQRFDLVPEDEDFPRYESTPEHPIWIVGRIMKVLIDI